MSASLDIEWAPEVRQRLDRVAGLIFASVLIVTASSLVAVLLLHWPWQILFALPLLLTVVVVVRTPVIGMYALFAAALLIPVQPLGFADSLTDNIPFFANLSDSGSLKLSGLGITPAEIVMLLVFTGILGSLAAHRATGAAGRLMVPYLVFGGSIVLGELNGLVHGGDFKLSLWELRPQAYGLAMFVMTTVLLRNRSQIKVLLVILVLAEAVVAFIGCFRYFVTLDRQVLGALPILAHEDSYLLGLFVVAVVIGLIWFRRPVLVLLVALSPIVVTAIVVNHRRAGIGSLGLEITAVVVLAYVLEPRLRSSLLRVGAVALVLGVVFAAVFWNQQYGAPAELIRPIKSLVDPTARDLSSDLYRVSESANLKLTFRTSPLIGVGFGHPYYIVYPQAGIQRFDPLWNIIPHNNLLWIPMRMGIVGMVTFWCLISLAIVEAIAIARAIRDRFVRGALILALAAILGVLFTGYYDIGIESYRNLIVLGVLLAAINRAELLAGERAAPVHEAPKVSAGNGRFQSQAPREVHL